MTIWQSWGGKNADEEVPLSQNGGVFQIGLTSQMYGSTGERTLSVQLYEGG